MRAKWFSIDGCEIDKPEIQLDEKRLGVACSMMMTEYDLEIVQISFNWAVLGDSNRRLLVDCVDSEI